MTQQEANQVLTCFKDFANVEYLHERQSVDKITLKVDDAERFAKEIITMIMPEGDELGFAIEK